MRTIVSVLRPWKNICQIAGYYWLVLFSFIEFDVELITDSCIFAFIFLKKNNWIEELL